MPPHWERDKLKLYASAIAMWMRRYNTAEIADQIDVDEAIVERWVHNFREQARGAVA